MKTVLILLSNINVAICQTDWQGRARHARNNFFLNTNVVCVKNILTKKCVNYDKSNLRLNSVKGPKDQIVPKKNDKK